METMNVLQYFGMAILVMLLVIFEIRDGNIIRRTPAIVGYEYYTTDSRSVRIRHVFGSLYKVYVNDECPVSTKHDRYGNYFTLRAGSAWQAEQAVDELYGS